MFVNFNMASKDKRKLAAIMFVDVVGYSRMMASNEERTLELLKDFENICSPIISDNEGVIIKKVGDELFCEFSSAKQAVDSALVIQKAIQPYNDSRPKDFKLQVRIGIHVGDIVLRDGDVFGDGVNIASRIQPFASPGGICISSAVKESISSHPNYNIQSEGQQELKNIIEKHTLYRIKTGYESKTGIRNNYKKFRTLGKVLIGSLVIFIAGILFFGDSMNIGEIEATNEYQNPQKVLLHITSLSEYANKYEGKGLFGFVKGRKLIPLSSIKLDSIRKNVESLLLGEYINTHYEMIVKYSFEDVNFLNKYFLLTFDDTSFSNVSINYKRFNFDNIHYINIYQYQNKSDNETPKYFFKEMKWFNLPKIDMNGSLVRSDFTNIEDEIFDIIKGSYSGSGKIGKVASVLNDIIYIQLTNLNIKKNMNLEGSSLYEYAKDGRKNRIDDLMNAIGYLSNNSDSVSALTIEEYNDEIQSIQDGTGFNWFSDSIRVNNRGFTTDFWYKLKVIDLRDDSIAVTKVTELSYPYVTIRAGDVISIEK